MFIAFHTESELIVVFTAERKFGDEIDWPSDETRGGVFPMKRSYNKMFIVSWNE